MNQLQDDLTDSEKTAGGHADDFEISPLGKRLMEIRRKFIAEGGKLLSREELARQTDTPNHALQGHSNLRNIG